MSDAIVITAGEVICSIGLTREQAWAQLMSGGTGIRTLTALEQPPSADLGGGQAIELPLEFASDLPREARYLRWLIDHLMQEVGRGGVLPYEAKRIGIVMGTTLHGIRAAGRFFRDGDYRHWKWFQSSSLVSQAISGISIQGLALTTCAACASGLAAIGIGATLLRAGELDAVICGGYDPISEYAYGGFSALRLIAPQEVRPFGLNRQGMKLGEGYAAVFMERQAGAQRRGASVMATILGFGESADAHHLTQPHPLGIGAASAMNRALQQAELASDDVDVLFAHATGTPDNDRGEHAALAKVFGDQLRRMPVVAFKSRLGHTLGGAGAVELVLAMTAMDQSQVPPTAGVQDSPLEFDELRILSEATAQTLNICQSNSIGFGGTNASMVMGRGDSDATRARVASSSPRRAVITGIGIVLPGMIGNDAFVNRLARCRSSIAPDRPVIITDAELEPLISAKRVRRLSEYVKLTLAATTLACRDAALDAALQASSSVMHGTNHGSARYSEDYYREIVEKGIDAANPMLFAEGVPNAAAAHLSMAMGCLGGCQTFIGSRTSGLDALHMAALRIATGECDRVIVSAAEEATPLMHDIYGRQQRQLGVIGSPASNASRRSDREPFRCSSGAITLIVESEEESRQRGLQPRAIIESVRNVVAKGASLRDFIREGHKLWIALDAPTRVAAGDGRWWLSRAEARMSGADRKQGRATSIQLRETFSVMPMAAMAVGLLDRTVQHGNADVEDRSFGVICAGLDGLIAAARIRPMAR